MFIGYLPSSPLHVAFGGFIVTFRKRLQANILCTFSMRSLFSTPHNSDPYSKEDCIWASYTRKDTTTFVVCRFHIVLINCTVFLLAFTDKQSKAEDIDSLVVSTTPRYLYWFTTSRSLPPRDHLSSRSRNPPLRKTRTFVLSLLTRRPSLSEARWR